jgi:hypothetical protein
MHARADVFSLCVTEIVLICLEVITKNDEMSRFVSNTVSILGNKLGSYSKASFLEQASWGIRCWRIDRQGLMQVGPLSTYL